MKYLTLVFFFSFGGSSIASSSRPNSIELTTSQAICLGFKIEERVNDSLYLRIPIIKNQSEEYPSTVIILYSQQGDNTLISTVDINHEAKKSTRISLDYKKEISDVSISVLYSREFKGSFVPSIDIYGIKSFNNFQNEESLGCLE